MCRRRSKITYTLKTLDFCLKYATTLAYSLFLLNNLKPTNMLLNQEILEVATQFALLESSNLSIFDKMLSMVWKDIEDKNEICREADKMTEFAKLALPAFQKIKELYPDDYASNMEYGPHWICEKLTILRGSIDTQIYYKLQEGYKKLLGNV